MYYTYLPVAICVISHSVHGSQHMHLLSSVLCCCPAVLVALILRAYHRMRSNLLHLSLCSGELINLNFGRPAVVAKMLFLVPRMYPTRGIIQISPPRSVPTTMKAQLLSKMTGARVKYTTRPRDCNLVCEFRCSLSLPSDCCCVYAVFRSTIV